MYLAHFENDCFSRFYAHFDIRYYVTKNEVSVYLRDISVTLTIKGISSMDKGHTCTLIANVYIISSLLLVL